VEVLRNDLAPGRPSRAVSQRRWLIRLVSMLCVFVTLLGCYAVHERKGVFWSRVNVRLLLPSSSQNPNVLRNSSHSLIMTAGLIALIADPSGGKTGLADQSVTLASEGLRHGWAVTMLNSGGQWVNNFDQPAVQVEAVGTTVAEVTQEMQTALSRVDNALKAQEAKADIDPNTAIGLVNSTSPSPMYYQGGSQIRGLAGVIALGLIVTLSARTILRRWLFGPGSEAAESRIPTSIESIRQPVGSAAGLR
jgi:hypothetical protein